MIRKKQTGRGLVGDALKQGFRVSKNTILQGLRTRSSEKLKNVALDVVERELRQNLPIVRAPLSGLIPNHILIPMVKNKVATAIDAKINKIMGGQRGK